MVLARERPKSQILMERSAGPPHSKLDDLMSRCSSGGTAPCKYAMPRQTSSAIPSASLSGRIGPPPPPPPPPPLSGRIYPSSPPLAALRLGEPSGSCSKSKRLPPSTCKIHHFKCKIPCFDTQFLVFETRFLVLNTKFMIFTHKLRHQAHIRRLCDRP